MVAASEKLQALRAAIAHQVACLIHPLAVTKRVREKALSGEGWLAIVATGQAAAGDVEVADDAWRHRFERFIQDIHARVRYRAA
jgi:hypothetical protein